MTVKQDLEKAVEVLDARDWCQGKFQAQDGKVCAKGAIMVAVGYETDEYGQLRDTFDTWHGPMWQRRVDATRVLSLAVPEEIRQACIPKCECAVAAYNDADTTTVEDVKLMFKRAIESCDE